MASSTIASLSLLQAKDIVKASVLRLRQFLIDALQPLTHTMALDLKVSIDERGLGLELLKFGRSCVYLCVCVVRVRVCACGVRVCVDNTFLGEPLEKIIWMASILSRTAVGKCMTVLEHCCTQ